MAPPDPSYTFVNCVLEKWNSPWLAHQPLMAQMAARGHKVIYVLKEPSFDEVMRDVARGSFSLGGLRQVDEGVYETKPSMIYPRFYFSRTADRWSRALRAQSLRRKIKALGNSQAILYLWNPLFVDLIDALPEMPCVFHCHDYYPHFYAEGTAARAAMIRQFEMAIDAADVVCACSEALHDFIAERRRDNLHLVENGVDVDLYQSSDKAPELAGRPRPVIGHIGRINKKIDLDVLIQIARARPQWTVLLMGPKTGWDESCERKFEALAAFPNVLYVEGKRREKLAPYFNSLDVGLMSYKKAGTWTEFGFPLKLFEYFSAGKPVVGTDLPSIRKYADQIQIVADDAPDWVAAVESALASNSPDKAAARRQLSEANSWSNRADQVLEILHNRIEAEPVAASS